jgi:hypothetical protein
MPGAGEDAEPFVERNGDAELARLSDDLASRDGPVPLDRQNVLLTLVDLDLRALTERWIALLEHEHEQDVRVEAQLEGMTGTRRVRSG